MTDFDWDGRLHELSALIATATEPQKAAMPEIASNIQALVSSLGEMTQTIRSLSVPAQGSAAASG